MIRTEQEYREALERLAEDREVQAEMRRRLEEQGLKDREVERVMEPAIAFHTQLAEEVETYEQIKRGEFQPLYNLTQIGRLLIGLRIALGLSQKELADRLEVSAAAVSRDERNEYHGVSVEKVQRILEALDVRLRLELDEPVPIAA